MTPFWDVTNEVAAFVAWRIPHCRRGFGENQSMGVLDDEGRLVAGVVYHNHDPEAGLIEMSGASLTPRWLTRRVLVEMYWYPFIHCGCHTAVMRVPADDERLLYILARYGYKFIDFPMLFGRERDGKICRLTVEAWAANKFNQQRAAAMQEAA